MKRKILIVDDETMMTELLSDHLGDEGYETMTANSAWAAIELLNALSHPRFMITNHQTVN